MWEGKEQAIDVNYNADELWFVGVYLWTARCQAC
jgi:hypothetical protein